MELNEPRSPLPPTELAEDPETPYIPEVREGTSPTEDQSPIPLESLLMISGRVIRPPRDWVTMLPPNGTSDISVTDNSCHCVNISFLLAFGTLWTFFMLIV